MKSRKLETVRVDARLVNAYVKAVREGRGIVHTKSTKSSLKTNSTTKPLNSSLSQKEAIKYASDVVLKYQNDLSIHGRNGRIKKKFIDGKYSFPPRG